MSKKVNELSFGIGDAILERKIEVQHKKNVAAVKKMAQEEPNKNKREQAVERTIAILESEKAYYNNVEKDARRILNSCINDAYRRG